MNRILIIAADAIFALSLLLLSGCIDDKYNLSDIDTTSEFSVNGLVLPLNLDEITLKSIFNINEDSKIKEIDGEYVVVVDGEFSSGNVAVNRIEVAAPVIPSSSTEITMPANLCGSVIGVGADATVVTVALPIVGTSFSVEAENVAEEIIDIEHLKIDFGLTMRCEIPQFAGVLKGYKLKNLRMQMPKGMKCVVAGAEYNATTGIVTIPVIEATGKSAEVKFLFSELDAKQSGLKFSKDNHTIKYEGELRQLSGELEVAIADIYDGASIPAKVNFNNDYVATKLTVTEFTGRMAYHPTGLSPEPFTLDGLPDVFTQQSTDISITNPQIYVNVSNPLSDYGLTADVDLVLNALREGEPANRYAPDDGAFVLSEKNSNYCLSPTAPAVAVAGYENAKHVKFSSLAGVLSGKGMPSRIAIELDNTMLPEQRVASLPLGKDFGKYEGKYKFYAPLNLKAGSKVVYTDTEAGWNDDDVDKIVIKHIEATATVSSDCPVEAVFSAYPVDVNGNQIEGVSVQVSVIPANAQSEPLKIVIEGEVKHLDGITFQAVATAKDGETLSPQMKIKLDNVKVKVSGNYVTEL